MAVALGLMSGTSGDGVSAALASFKGHSFKLLACQTFPYPKKLRQKIGRAPTLALSEISSLNMELGHVFAEAALKLIRASRFPKQKIAVIGSHGQTVYHGPRDAVPSTFQIGEAAVVAEETGIPVVSDFRPQDIALGGEGAPLVPFFDFYFYGRGSLRAFQNIGGIANVTLVGRGLKAPVAFDTGPGNCLMDLAIQKTTRGRLSHDASGKWAERGRIEKGWLRAMLRHPYFSRRPPKSTGREEFGEKFLRKQVGISLSRRPHDVLATLNFFTALTICESVKRFGPSRLKEVIVSGGGAFNRTLMRNLKGLFSPVPVKTIEDFGIPAQAKEPMAFAFLALRAWQGKINHLPETTGAKRETILGKITCPGIVIARSSAVSAERRSNLRSQIASAASGGLAMTY